MMTVPVYPMLCYAELISPQQWHMLLLGWDVCFASAPVPMPRGSLFLEHTDPEHIVQTETQV
jgi:hypothetical protein